MTQTETVSIEREGMAMDVWLPDRGGGPGVLLIQEIFGVGSYIRAVAERLAAAGYVVGAPDVFWRFAPGWAANHDEAGMGESFAQVANLDPQLAVADCVAGLEHLVGLDEVEGRPGVLGFCLGGTLAFGVAIADAPAVCVSYYGSGVADMIGRLDEVECPVLFHFGRNDPYIPFEAVEAVAAAIDDRHDVVVNVEEAGHAFDNHEAEIFWHEPAAKAAWSKTMAFLAQHLPTS